MDTIFTGAGLLILVGGIYAAVLLRHVRLETERSAEEAVQGTVA